LPLLKENHPNPGQPYTGTTMTTSLPDLDVCSSVGGEQVCRLLKVAFQRKLLFTIRGSGRSGGYKVVPFGDVSHHTTRYVLMVDRLIKRFKVRDNVDFMQ